ncbi:hypothetical protein COCCADRAFT_5090 [Bipolaris zeicola 26-R-13]|uniref:Uncharacterized protein n=1 Tax=Cochliobolus carbonum (strain 26-R-13) TaxID=930089 RepID=W6Y694_COCC2|nr:uncharacterized protein COCCADRAFT_5090 [Bipolaris zeicola 26-R-13]EUC33353.1 hypothetical protein COCCADRAFT_5090 [Bipolaris zeicola 26-R-13]
MDSSKEELFLMCEEARKECEDFMETCKIEDMGRGFWAPFWRSASQMSLSLTKSFLSVEMERSQPEWWNHEVIQRHLETIHRVRKYERKLRYLVHDKEIFPLPREDIRAAEPLELEVAVLGETKHSVVAARVMFLLRARKEGRSTFPSDGGLRYGGLDFSAFTVK